VPNLRITLSSKLKKDLVRAHDQACIRGDIRVVKRAAALLAVAHGETYQTISETLRVDRESIRLWVNAFLLKKLDSLKYKKSPGRPPKLTKSQRDTLAQFIEDGPEQAGFPGAFIQEKFGVFYSVHYLSQLLKNMGFSYQKARFVSGHLNPEKRSEWRAQTWPQILRLARDKGASILFGDEASFPQWGTLTYTWARRGVQPTVETSGKRKGYKIFGLIDYATGRLFSKAQEGRFNSLSYAAFLREVLAQTNQHLILIQDGARYHTSKAMQQFFAEHSDRLTVYQLPSYSPDYNPIEKLWKKIKQTHTHLHYFPTFDALKDKVDEALTYFDHTPEEVLSLCGLDELLEAA
jgi:transposase